MWQITLHQKAQQKLKIEGILKRETHYNDQIFFFFVTSFFGSIDPSSLS